MEKVLENQTFFFYFWKIQILYRKAIHSEQKLYSKNNVYSRIFSKKVLLLGQSYNSVLGFSSTCISQKEENFSIFYFLDYVFSHT